MLYILGISSSPRRKGSEDSNCCISLDLKLFVQALSLFIALSTLGNLLAGHFIQGRGVLQYHELMIDMSTNPFSSRFLSVIQELSREGIFPFSTFFASNKPFNAPLAGLSFQYVLSCIFLFSVPPGDAYLFLVNCKAGIINHSLPS